MGDREESLSENSSSGPYGPRVMLSVKVQERPTQKGRRELRRLGPTRGRRGGPRASTERAEEGDWEDGGGRLGGRRKEPGSRERREERTLCEYRKGGGGTGREESEVKVEKEKDKRLTTERRTDSGPRGRSI